MKTKIRAWIQDKDLQEFLDSKGFTFIGIKSFTGIGKFQLDGYVEVELAKVEKEFESAWQDSNTDIF